MLAVARPDRLEVKPTIPDASDGMARGVGIQRVTFVRPDSLTVLAGWSGGALDHERAQGEAPASWRTDVCEQTAAACSCTRTVSLGVRMCCHGMVYERFSQQRSNVNPDSCPAHLMSAVVVLVHHLFASSRRRRSSPQGFPGLIIDSWGRSSWSYLLRGVAWGLELLSTGSGSDSKWPPTWGWHTNI